MFKCLNQQLSGNITGRDRQTQTDTASYSLGCLSKFRKIYSVGTQSLPCYSVLGRGEDNQVRGRKERGGT